MSKKPPMAKCECGHRVVTHINGTGACEAWLWGEDKQCPCKEFKAKKVKDATNQAS